MSEGFWYLVITCATLQQSSDLFYQKFLKIESKILPLPASAAAARKRGLRGKGIAAAASAFARPAIWRGLLLAKFFDTEKSRLKYNQNLIIFP